MSALRSVEGIGSKLEGRILDEVGGEEGLDRTVEELRVEAVSGIEGIGDERAVEIFRQLLGMTHSGLASTGRARQVRDSVIDRVAGRARTSYGRNRARLLTTLDSREAAEERLDDVMGYAEVAGSLPLDGARGLLDEVEPLREPGPREGPLVIVEDEGTHAEMVESGLDGFCRLSTLSDRPSPEGEFAVYYYSERVPDLVDAPNVEPVRDRGEHWRAVPGSVLAFFEENYSALRAAGDLLGMLGEGEACREAAEEVERLRSLDGDPSDVRSAVERVREETSREVYGEVKDLSLKGSEVLECLGEGAPGAVEEVLDRRIAEAERELRAELGVSISPFTREFPLGVDYSEVERVEAEAEAMGEADVFSERLEAAEALRSLRGEVEAEVRRAMELDFELALGGFAVERGLTRPEFGEEVRLEGALHLDLPDGEPVDYSLGEAVLLTGANSGGKTTLLETVAQVVVMSHMGLPVPAASATVEWFDGLHFYSPRGGLDAGAFESFLRDFIPLCRGGSRRLILADELEAVTELEAAASIIAGFVDRVRGSGSRCVIVTHMPDQISSRTEVRVDGIEASGLGDDGELLVDRSPVVGRRASSTPELILERLAREGDDGLFSEFLEVVSQSKESNA